MLEVDSVRAYLVEIGSVPLLTKEQEQSLGRKIQAGLVSKDPKVIKAGKIAESKMISANLRLVVAIAKRYRDKKDLDLMDLFQEGNLGLAIAVKKFDPNRGYKFSTYAYWWIRQSITRAIADKSQKIRIPNHIHENFCKYLKACEKIRASGERVTEEKLLSILGWKKSKLQMVLAGKEIACFSLDKAVVDKAGGKFIDDSNKSLGDFLSKDESNLIYGQEMKDFVAEFLSILAPSEAEILSLRFGLKKGTSPLPLHKIGEMVTSKTGEPYCRETIRKKIRMALNKIRAYAKKNNRYIDLV